MNIKKDFFKGVSLYATESSVQESEVQVRLTIGQRESEPIDYQWCINWQPNRYTNYNEVMGRKIINITEALVVPMLHQAMVKWARTLDISFENFSGFLFKKDDVIGVAIYDKTTPKKLCPIEELLG
jgi:hypothetical protein